MKINLKEGSHRLAIIAAFVCLVAILVETAVDSSHGNPLAWSRAYGRLWMFPLGTYLAVRIVGWTVDWLVAGLAGNEPRD